MKKLILICTALFALAANADEKTFPLTFTLPNPLDFPANVVTDFKVKLKNTSDKPVGHGIRVALGANESVLKVINGDALVDSIAAGEEKTVTFKVQAISRAQALGEIPVAFEAYLADGTMVAQLKQNPIGNITKFYSFRFDNQQRFTSTDKQIEFYELDITNTFHAYLYTGLQLELEFYGKEDGHRYEIIGGNTIYLAPLAKKHTKTIPLAVRTYQRFKDIGNTATLKIKLYENGVLVSDEEITEY